MKTTAPKSERRGDWLTIRQLAGVLGVTVQGFRASWLPDIAPADIQPGKGSRPTKVFAPAVVTLHTERALRRAVRADGETLLDAGPASPSLERWRKARAGREEIELLHRLKELVAVAEVREAMLQVAEGARRFAERQIATYGQVPAGDWAEVIEEITRTIERRLRLTARRRELTIWVDEGQPITIDLDTLSQEHLA